MAAHQIICTRMSPATTAGHHHITAVGVGSGSTYDQLLSVSQVYQLMNTGDRFSTLSPSTGRWASVMPWACCGLHTLRSGPDSVTDNNLDNLARCA